jgi:hypothetical protein
MTNNICFICSKDISNAKDYGAYAKTLDGSGQDLCNDCSKDLLAIEVEYQVRRKLFWGTKNGKMPERNNK